MVKQPPDDLQVAADLMFRNGQWSAWWPLIDLDQAEREK